MVEVHPKRDRMGILVLGSKTRRTRTSLRVDNFLRSIS